MKLILFSIIFLLMLNIGFAQPIPIDSLYFGQTPPGNTPEMFKLPVEKGAAMERIAISPDNKQIYYTELIGW